jgi:hypothetical protein
MGIFGWAQDRRRAKRIRYPLGGAQGPSPEPWGRRARIGAGQAGVVTIAVKKYIDEAVADFARRTQIPTVPAVSKHLPMAPEAAVQALGETNCEALHAAAKRIRIVRFHDGMNVLELYRIVQHAETAAIRFSKLALNGSMQGPQRRKRSPNAQGDMNRLIAGMLRPTLMRRAGQPRQRSLAACAFACPSALTESQRKLMSCTRAGSRCPLHLIGH